MDTGEDPNAANPRRRNRRRRFYSGAASRPPAVVDGADPNPTVDPLVREHWRQRHEQMSRRRGNDPYGQTAYGRVILGRSDYERACELARRLGPSARRSQASSSAAPPSDPPGAIQPVTSTRIRQSVLYSNRPRRPQHRQVPAPTEEHPSEVSSSELGGAVTDLPTLEALSLSDPPPLTPQITGEETDDDDDASSHLYRPEDRRLIRPTGLTTSMLLSLGDSLFTYVSVEEMMRKPDSDVDSEELRRQMQEYYVRHPPVSLEEGMNRTLAVEYARMTARCIAKGIEPPRGPFRVDQEAPSLQAQEEDSAAAAPPQDSMAISHEASTGVIKDGKQWMRDEVILCFRKHVEKTPCLAGLVFELDELCHQCFNVENNMKVFHHYNFKIRMKMPASAEWTKELYFGEVKEIFGRKFYFCCPLEPNESGHCHACKNQGVEDLKHPVTGGFEIGLPDGPISSFWYSEISDDEAGGC